MLNREGIWTRVEHDKPFAIDLRHADWMHDVLQYGFNKCLEIGSHKGTSLCTFLEAKQAGKIQELHVAEPVILHELLRVVGGISVTYHRRGVDALRTVPGFDFVHVDGDHTLKVVREEIDEILKAGVPTIMAHDTNSTAIGVGLCEGAHLLKQTFMTHPDFYCLEDNMLRENEITHRGMFFATKDREVWQYAKECLREIQK